MMICRLISPQIFNACWIPIVYAFFPETANLQLEDIDHLFDKGGITGGVLKAKGGRTVEPGHHAYQANLAINRKVLADNDEVDLADAKAV